MFRTEDIYHPGLTNTIAVFTKDERDAQRVAESLKAVFGRVLTAESMKAQPDTDTVYPGYGFTLTIQSSEPQCASYMRSHMHALLSVSHRMVLEEPDTRRRSRQPGEMAAVFILAR